MPVKIEKITVKNLGPISDFSKDMGLFNLIFSRNECGKTFLTEFIIRSLFKNIKRWQFRENGNGKVTLSGLSQDGSLVDFSPSTPKKLEDYWEEDSRGLPASLAKLLVSKGGEAAIEETNEGIGKSLIKEVFSGISLLDRIDSDNNISKTLKGAQYEDGNLIIQNTGEGKMHRQLKTELAKIDSLFEEIESKYKSGMLADLKATHTRLREKIGGLHRAKCHTAYLISENIKKLNLTLKQNDEEELGRISQEITLFSRDTDDYKIKSAQLGDFINRCRDYEWLQKAIPLYEKLSATSHRKPPVILIVLAGIFALAAIIFSVFSIMPGTITSLVVAIGLITFYLFRLSSSARNSGATREFEKLAAEFTQRTSNNALNMASLLAESEKQKEYYDKSRLLKEQLDTLGLANQSQKSKIMQLFYSLTGNQVTEENWQAELGKRRETNRAVMDKIEGLRSRLLDLAVRDIEYITEDPGISFSYNELESAESELEKTEKDIKEIEQNIAQLKYAICSETGDDQSIEWLQLLDNLRKKRQEKQIGLEDIEARIIAGILVHSEISQLRLEEDKKISDGLQSEVVLKPLSEITGRYRQLFLENDTLMVSDNYKDYCIRDLSTGAREQVMLAMRIGFTSRVLNQDSLFLILDDAFQHSDWEKRKILVGKLADIAQSGWQIIYFSMDNHIRELFDKAGARFKNGQYKCIELAN
jgi:uncharacterized protein YhaN